MNENEEWHIEYGIHPGLFWLFGVMVVCVTVGMIFIEDTAKAEEKGAVRAEWFATGAITVPVEGGAPGDTVTTDFVWDGSEGTDDIWNSSCTDCALQLRQEYPIIVDEVEVARMKLYTRSVINRARREGFVSR